MLYLSKLFLLQQSFLLRSLHGIVIFSSVVAITGCESIRINDVASSGYRTLFYISEPVTNHSFAETDIKESSHVEAKATLLFEKEPKSRPERLAQTPPFIKVEQSNDTVAQKPSHEASLGAPTSTLTLSKEDVVQHEMKMEEDFHAPSQSPLNSLDSNTELNEKIGQDNHVLSFDFLAWLNSLFEKNPESESDALALVSATESTDAPEEDEKNEILVAQINALNDAQPASAGTPPELSSSNTLSNNINETIINRASNDAALKKQNKKTKVLNEKVKQALRKADIEILSWQLEMQRAINNNLDCRLSSPTLQLESDDYTTQVWLNIENNQLTLNATTHIDPNLPFVGIYLDNGKIEKFLPNEHPLHVVWGGNLSDLIASNTKLQMVIGGNDLKTQVQLAAIDLNNLRQIYPKYLACTQRVLGKI